MLTRPLRRSQAFWQRLDRQCPGLFAPVFAPLTEIRDVDAELDFSNVRALLFTSGNAVTRFAARWDERGKPAFCVGDATAVLAGKAGMQAVSAQGDAAALAGLVSRELRPGEGELLHVRGKYAVGELAENLARAGFAVREAIIYDQAVVAFSGDAGLRLATGAIDVITFFSPRAAGLFASAAAGKGWKLGAATAVCLSAACEVDLRALGFGRMVHAGVPNASAMIVVLARLGQA